MTSVEMRYAFAMSAFARLFQPNKITLEMTQLCKEWSEGEDEIPTTWDLPTVDQYFLSLLNQ
jgi:hypothetical protein